MNDYNPYNLEEIKESIDNAEALSVFFPTLRKAVVIDTRHNDTAGPMIRIMPMTGSPEERIRIIRHLRPNFPSLQNLTLVPWTGYIDSLVSLGIWDSIVRRFNAVGQEDVVTVCDLVLEELRRLEKTELGSVVRGENYNTIWSARR